MLKSKVELEKYLEKKILTFTVNTEVCNRIYDYALEKHNIPRVITSDYLTLRNPLEEASDFILFCLLEAIEAIREEKTSVIPQFYVSAEIKKYSTAEYKVDKIKFPLRLKAIQINEDQWMSSIDFNLLMKLRAGQLINYNENTQRTMEKIVRGDKEVYVITRDKTAIAQIEKAYKDNTYISTPLTFNIPEDSNAEFYYNEDTNELVINSLEYFDIVDGYHRYLAACKACDSDKNINRNMELRVVAFPEYKAQQFIFQEDQKTKMRKADSNTFNQTDVVNQIITKINTSPISNLNGLISRNDGVINFVDFADVINYFYFNNKKDVGNAVKIKITNEIINNFNGLTEYDLKYLGKYSYQRLFVIMYCFTHLKEQSNIAMYKIIDELVDKMEKKNIKFTCGMSKKVVLNEIDSELKGMI